MSRPSQYHLKEEMRRLADRLFEVSELYQSDQPKMALAAFRELRMLAMLGHEVESGGQLGQAGQALLQISHIKKVEAAITKRRKAPLPIDVEFTEVHERRDDGNGAN